MSFAEDVKNELCAYEPETDTDVAMKIEASCLLRNGWFLITRYEWSDWCTPSHC